MISLSVIDMRMGWFVCFPAHFIPVIKCVVCGRCEVGGGGSVVFILTTHVQRCSGREACVLFTECRVTPLTLYSKCYAINQPNNTEPV